MLIPFSHISKAQGVDLLSSWFISMVAQQATAQIDQVNSGPNFGKGLRKQNATKVDHEVI